MAGEVAVGAGCSAGFLIVSPGNVGVDLKTMIQLPRPSPREVRFPHASGSKIERAGNVGVDI